MHRSPRKRDAGHGISDKDTRKLDGNHQESCIPDSSAESTAAPFASQAVDVPLLMKGTRKPVKDVGELFDDLIHYLGVYGTYQQRLIFLIILPLFFSIAIINCVMVFQLFPDPDDYHCNLPEMYSDKLMEAGLGNFVVTSADRDSLLPFEIPEAPSSPTLFHPSSAGKPNPHSACRMWNTNYTHLFIEQNGSFSAMSAILNSTQTQNLTSSTCLYGWEYSMQRWDSSVITEWDLVCQYSHTRTVLTILLVVVFVLGLVAGGFCADKWGRKNVFFAALFIFITFGLSSAFAPTYPAFVILLLIHAFGSGPLYYLLYTAGVENLTLRSRVTFVVWLSVLYSIGSMVFILVAYFVRNWRNLTIIGTTPFFLLFIYWFFMPESPRWLLVHERYEEVENYFRRVARINGKAFDQTAQDYLKAIFLQCEREVNIDHHQLSRWKRAAWTRLFITPTMRRKTLLLLYLICTLQICYQGLQQYTPSLSGSDDYFNYFLVSLLEIPGYCLTALLCDRLGRRVTLLIMFGAAFLSCISTLAFPSTQEYYWGIIAVFFLAKIFYAGAYIVGELLMYETFPTVIRLQGIAFVESVAYIISHLGFAIVSLQFHSTVLPLIIFGCMGLVAMLCVFLLPETVSYALPETVEEADMRGSFFRKGVNLRVPEFRMKNYSVIYKKGKPPQNNDDGKKQTGRDIHSAADALDHTKARNIPIGSSLERGVEPEKQTPQFKVVTRPLSKTANAAGPSEIDEQKIPSSGTKQQVNNDRLSPGLLGDAQQNNRNTRTGGNGSSHMGTQV